MEPKAGAIYIEGQRIVKGIERNIIEIVGVPRRYPVVTIGWRPPGRIGQSVRRHVTVL